MKANVMAAVSLDSSAERFSGLVFSLTIAVEIVMVCGGGGAWVTPTVRDKRKQARRRVGGSKQRGV